METCSMWVCVRFAYLLVFAVRFAMKIYTICAYQKPYLTQKEMFVTTSGKNVNSKTIKFQFSNPFAPIGLWPMRTRS